MTPSAIQCDFYKTGHQPMYPLNTVKLYSNLTPRKSRLKGVDHVVVFAIQYFCLEYLIGQWNESFFRTDLRNSYNAYRGELGEARYAVNMQAAKDSVIYKYKRMMDNTLGKDLVSTEHLEKLWDLGYLPLQLKALPEGTLCPIGVPCLTITNTVDHAFWLVNYIETILSCTIWQGMTSATIAHEYRKLLDKYAFETTGSKAFVQFQGHDFSMRGMSSLESACTSGAGHLLSFVGTDTVPAINFLEQYYGANIESEMVGTSIPATEHSVMCMGTKDDEIDTFRRLITEIVPKGPISIVSDTWDLWKVCREYLPALKEEILSRDGKVVIRPDSGDPVDIICGKIPEGTTDGETRTITSQYYCEHRGVIELLWEVFGGKVNEYGYKELDPHIGAIYGDSITLERAETICDRLKAKGFASTNVVFGIGSYTYQYNTRDTFGFAMKATYGEVMELKPGKLLAHATDTQPEDWEVTVEPVGREIFKAPITDSGEKKSAKGLLAVEELVIDGGDNGRRDLVLHQQCTYEQEQGGLLETVFLDGQLAKFQTLTEIRQRLRKA